MSASFGPKRPAPLPVAVQIDISPLCRSSIRPLAQGPGRQHERAGVLKFRKQTFLVEPPCRVLGSGNHEQAHSRCDAPALQYCGRHFEVLVHARAARADERVIDASACDFGEVDRLSGPPGSATWGPRLLTSSVRSAS